MRLNYQYVAIACSVRPTSGHYIRAGVSGIGILAFMLRIYFIRNYSRRFKKWMV
jgi:hypothetical protein